ncbi:alpha/beta hydrolase-fold protein [candidate division CSSED10-310 bacterium]|uniref:Alpha/beta hydrolase-fold protein n=1 Tax=candidate division CSSED10-310 bacterium TaxID=2855610 RepID=A0ABV6YU08_UNCC1
MRKQTTIMVILVVFVFMSSSLCFAKTKEKDIIIGQVKTINSKVLGEERPFLVYCPDGYKNTKVKYPVLYLLDGNGHFHYGTGIVSFLSNRGSMPQMIVVGIPNTDRQRDFTPTKVEKRPNSGGADAFLTFMKEELMPYIDQNYRTQPYNILFGHSLCGMFSIYSLLNTTDLFNAYIAASPWLVYDDNYVMKQAESLLDKNFNTKSFLYVTVGDEPEIIPSVKELENLLHNMPTKNVVWQTRFMDDEDHGSITFKTIYDGLKTLYGNWRINQNIYNGGLEAIEKHYKDLSQQFGYTIDIPEYVLNLYGYQLLTKEKFPAAITVLKINAEKYPYSANVYDSLGEAYEKDNQLKLAAKNYKMACKLGSETHPYFLDVYKKNLERVKKKLESR